MHPFRVVLDRNGVGIVKGRGGSGDDVGLVFAIPLHGIRQRVLAVDLITQLRRLILKSRAGNFRLACLGIRESDQVEIGIDVSRAPEPPEFVFLDRSADIGVKRTVSRDRVGVHSALLDQIARQVGGLEFQGLPIRKH